ncbi:unnamed protein product [Chrysodeixis includens]|uniref:Uncharacterized protein n=1 Tax=Chrysodeixis includens TaxID=689277 RepID=A0A9P0BVD4_CHRIL|nr:unnamed protein product [Chrysodeixis includens]
MFFQVASVWCVFFCLVDSAVLDPSLYLTPSPPLLESSHDISPGELWSQSVRSTMARDAKDPQTLDLGEKPSTKRKPQPMEKAKFFWPSFSSPEYRVGTGNIQVPLTFSLSGLYGKYSPGASTGVIGSSYGTVSDIGSSVTSLAGSGMMTSLAGSGYGKYRTYAGLRIYGGENGPAWSGWGNGKWGNYGKG